MLNIFIYKLYKMVRRRRKKGRVVPISEASSEASRSSQLGLRMPHPVPRTMRELAADRLVDMQRLGRALDQCQRELAALREENTILRRHLGHIGRAWQSVQGGRNTTLDHDVPRGGGRRTYRRRRRRRRRSRRSVPG